MSSQLLEGGIKLSWKGAFLAILCGLFTWVYSHVPIQRSEPGHVQSTEHSTLRAPAMDLVDLARRKGLKPPISEDQKAFLFRFSRSGLSLETVLLTPGAVFEAEIPSAGKTICVSVRIGMPFNLGDGVELTISAAQDGSEKVIIKRHLDPAHLRQHRTWLPLDFEIPSATDSTLLRFAVNPGPAGDLTGDWLGIAPGTSAGCLFSLQPSPYR
jgi:hypothetical protein